MNLELTPSQIAFKQSVEQFARDVVAPRAAAIDETGEFPLDVMRAAGERGLLRRDDSEGLGRRGLDYLSYALAIEAIARASATVAVVAVGHQLARRRSDRARRAGAAEGAVAAPAGVGRGDRRLRAVGARRRDRRGEPEDTRRAQRRGLSHHRPEGLGGERRSGVRRDRVRVHAARAARPGRDGVSRADGHARHHAHGTRRLARRSRPRLHGPRARHRGQRRSGARRRGPGLPARDVGAAGRARRDCGAGARHRRGGARRSHRATRRSARRSVSRSPTTRRSSGCWPTWRPSSKRRAC